TPEAATSSTAYCTSGLSTMGSISLGCAFVAGRKRVPSPATGKTAFRMLIPDLGKESSVISYQRSSATCHEQPTGKKGAVAAPSTARAPPALRPTSGNGALL